MAGLSSPHFPSFYAFGKAHGHIYLAEELLEPGELPRGDRPRAKYAVPANDAVKIGDFALNGQGLVRIAWTCDGQDGRNHFLYGKPPFGRDVLTLQE